MYLLLDKIKPVRLFFIINETKIKVVSLSITNISASTINCYNIQSNLQRIFLSMTLPWDSYKQMSLMYVIEKESYYNKNQILTNHNAYKQNYLLIWYIESWESQPTVINTFKSLYSCLENPIPYLTLNWLKTLFIGPISISLRLTLQSRMSSSFTGRSCLCVDWVVPLNSPCYRSVFFTTGTS